MKKWIAVGIFGILMTALARPALGQTVVGEAEPAKGTKRLPGYVEFDLSELVSDLKPSVSVVLEGAMIKMAAAASAEADTPLTELLDQLKLVQVKVYEDIDEVTPPVELHSFAAGKVAALKEKGWAPAVSVPEEDESVNVLVKSSDDFIHGLLVLVISDDEVVFVNVAGDIDPVVMGGMLGKLGAGVFTGDVDFEDLLFKGMKEEEEEGEEEYEVEIPVDDDPNASSESSTEEEENR
jgi:hypothetical protein